MERQPPSAIYKFGAFALDIQAGMLLRGVQPTLLGQRAIALLRLLLDRASSPVSKNDLIEAAWCHSACNIDPLSRGIGVQN